jgi:hypothetical protein
MIGPVEEADPDSERTEAMRLRSERPQITRLSRKMLAGGAAAGLIVIFGAALWALQNNRTRTASSGELYSLPVYHATMPVCRGKHRYLDRRCLAISGVQSSRRRPGTPPRVERERQPDRPAGHSAQSEYSADADGTAGISGPRHRQP